MSQTDPEEVRGGSGPINNLTENQGGNQGRPAVASTAAETAPRIAIAEALRNHWFEIWYQPKIDLKRRCLAGAEALARIRHPQLGVLPPGSFVPEVDEQSIADLAQHALMATLCDWSEFDEAGFNLHLAINVPAGVLLRLPIQGLLDECRPKSERWPGLIVEITEDQIVRDLALAKQISDQLQASGIKLAIDDFGAGYSSFSSMRHVPFAELKIDRSFVQGCTTDATNAAICQTAIDLAHRFGSAAVAEGIEAQTDLQALMVMGCDFGQGPLIAPPMPKERFLELLRQRMQRPPASPKDAMKAGGTPVGRVA